jgi:hypothetical protein
VFNLESYHVGENFNEILKFVDLQMIMSFSLKGNDDFSHQASRMLANLSTTGICSSLAMNFRQLMFDFIRTIRKRSPGQRR